MNSSAFRIAVLLCIFFSLLLHSCTSFQLGVHHSRTSLPRRLNAMVKATKTGKIVPAQIDMKEETTGGLHKKGLNMMQITGDKWREWEEVHDPSDLFTMDYRRVRRRRPIHNKSLHP